MRRADRDQLKAEIRDLLGVPSEVRALTHDHREAERRDEPIKSFRGADLSAVVPGIER
jgi:hypothetical protein